MDMDNNLLLTTEQRLRFVAAAKAAGRLWDGWNWHRQFSSDCGVYGPGRMGSLDEWQDWASLQGWGKAEEIALFGWTVENAAYSAYAGVMDVLVDPDATCGDLLAAASAAEALESKYGEHNAWRSFRLAMTPSWSPFRLSPFHKCE